MIKIPNRIIKESICVSEKIDALEPIIETFYYRLIVQCDDYGLFDGRVSIIRAKCFPLKLDKVSEGDIEEWITKLEQQGLIFIYFCENKRYLKVTKWEKHQQIRASKWKYPHPDRDKGILLKSIDINCNQPQANVPVIQSNPIQSESNPIVIEKLVVVVNAREGEMYKFFNENIQQLPSPAQNELLGSYLDDGMEPELMIEAMKDSQGKNDKWSYLKRILQKCFENKVLTHEEYMAGKKQFKELQEKPKTKQRTQDSNIFYQIMKDEGLV